jgi:hypothetical protein
MLITGRSTYRRSWLLFVVLGFIGTALVALPRVSHGQESLVETFDVDSSRETGTTSTKVLSPSKVYRVEVTGFYRYTGAAGLYLADAECSTNGTSIDWQRNRYGPVFTPADDKDDPLDLHVTPVLQGQTTVVPEPRDWTPLKGTGSDDGQNCSTTAHAYEVLVAPSPPPGSGLPGPGEVVLTADSRLNFRIFEPGPQDNLGKLTVKIFEVVVEQLVATASVPATSSSPTYAMAGTTRYTVQQGKTYRIEVSGTYKYTSGFNFAADAECSVAGSDNSPQEDRYGLILTPLDPTDDPLDLYMNGKAVKWSPEDADDGGPCSPTHVYQLTFVPQASGNVSFNIYEFNYGDNSGGPLTVNVFLIPIEDATDGITLPDPQAAIAQALEPLSGMTPHVLTPPNPDPILNPPPLKETLVATAVVDSSNPNGAFAKKSDGTNFDFLKGKKYRLEAAGVYNFLTSGNALADAECSSYGGDAWQKDRYGTLTPFDPLDDPLDLYVNGSNVDWTPASGTGCNSTTHVYNYVYEPQANGQVRFNVYEFGYGDNSGTLTVKVYRAEEALLETVVVDSHNAQGMTTINELKANTFYRFVVSQTFQYSGGLWVGYEGDAECTRTGFDPVWQPHRWDFAGFGDLADLQINKNPDPVGKPDPDWQPTIPDSTDPSSPRRLCNSTNHAYQRLSVSFPTKKRVTLVVYDVEDNMDNKGVLVVNIYECLTSPTPCYSS